MLSRRFFDKFQNFFVKNEKNGKIWFKLLQINGLPIGFTYFEEFFPENTNGKRFLPRGITPPHPDYGRRNISPIHAKIIYDLTIAIINK